MGWAATAHERFYELSKDDPEGRLDQDFEMIQRNKNAVERVLTRLTGSHELGSYMLTHRTNSQSFTPMELFFPNKALWEPFRVVPDAWWRRLLPGRKEPLQLRKANQHCLLLSRDHHRLTILRSSEALREGLEVMPWFGLRAIAAEDGVGLTARFRQQALEQVNRDWLDAALAGLYGVASAMLDAAS